MNPEEKKIIAPHPDVMGGQGAGEEGETERGIRVQRRATIRVTVTLVCLMLILVAATNIYVMTLVQMSAKHVRIMLFCLFIGSFFVIPFMVTLGIRWDFPAIKFGRIVSSGRRPTIEESQKAIASIVRFPMKLSVLMAVSYILAVAVVYSMLKYYFHFTSFELLSIGLMGMMVALNLGVVMYYAAKQLQRPQLERAARILFESGQFEFPHTRISLRYKMLVVFFMVVAYILVSSVLMGYGQVDRVEREQVEENLRYLVDIDSGQERLAGWSGGAFVLDRNGELLMGKNDNISPDDIKKMLAAKEGGMITDERAHKTIAFIISARDGTISGVVGFWGKSAAVRQGTWKLLLELIFAAILLCVVSTYLVVSDIGMPISQTVDYLKKLGRGEDIKSLRAYTDDEMGSLIGEVMRTTKALKERTRKSEDMLEAVRATVAALNETMGEVRTAGGEQAAAVREQVTAVEEALSASSEILATSKQISENAGDAEGAAEDNSRACGTGRNTILESLQGFDRLTEYVQSNSSSIMKVGGHYDKVRGIVAVIQEIAAQIDLLALNAQIEAAGAGMEGLRFTVVAEEVGRLASRTVEAVTEIRALINMVHAALQKLIAEAAEGRQLVESGSALADNVGTTIIGIQKLAERTSNLARGIALITRQQTTASEQMADTIKSIHDNAQRIMENTDLVQRSMHSQDDLAKKLASLLLANR